MYLANINELIDRTLVDIWVNEIPKDYKNEWLLQEDTLKCSIYLHLRNKLGKIFEDNGIRIYTEFTSEPFADAHKKPDIVIAKMKLDNDYNYLGEAVEEILAVIEVKYKTGFSSSKTIYNDYEKMKYYAQELGVTAKLYMATIWEYEDDPTAWEENESWTRGRLTELNASYIRDSDYVMQFYVWRH